MGGPLGCPDTQAYIQRKGGEDVLLELPYSSLSWGRKLDDFSEASVSVPLSGDGDECCDVLSDLDPWALELKVVRGNQEWIGVLLDPVYEFGEVRLRARDLFWWFEKRVLPKDRLFFMDDLSYIFQRYAEDALSRDNSMGIYLSVNDSGQRGTRSVLRVDHVRAADNMRELARSAVDFTMRGRQLIVSGVAASSSFKLVTEDFSAPTISIGSSEQATEVIVQGSDSEDFTDVYGVAGGVDPNLGLIQKVIAEDSISDNYSAEAAAEQHLAILRRAQVTVEGTLTSDAGVGMDELIPGRLADLRVASGCRKVAEVMRLVEVKVDVSVSDSGLTERVTPVFVPRSLDD